MTDEEKARRLRLKEIEELKTDLKELEDCTCLYPLVKMRNRVGHSDKCAVFERALKRLEEADFERLQYVRRP